MLLSVRVRFRSTYTIRIANDANIRHDDANMDTYKRITGSVIAITGFILSPLSWWNDLLVNIPLAYFLATIFAHVFPGHFAVCMMIAYWMTNIAGLVLLHKGGSLVLRGGMINSKRNIWKDLSISLVYSAVIIVLSLTGVLKLPEEYLH